MPADKRRCPECSGTMAEGHVIDYRYSKAHPSEWIEGALETSYWTGSVKNDPRYQVVAHRCEKCGYLKFYADKPSTVPGSPYR